VVEGAVELFWRGPVLPAVGLLDDGAIGFARKRCVALPLVLQVVEIFEKQDPRSLLGVIDLRGAARFLPQNVIDVFECLFEHAPGNLNVGDQPRCLSQCHESPLKNERIARQP
jgi:hypothetical protein